MTPDHWQRVKPILESALERPPLERAAFLTTACSGDPSLRSEIDSLIASYDHAGGGFLETPALEVIGDVLADDRGESLIGHSFGNRMLYFTFVATEADIWLMDTQ